jgi:predicted alpha-1,6-mannanase (GH76 family)
VKDSLNLFCNKPFEYLWKADYISALVKAEYRQEAVARGLIYGVGSDYQM